LTVSDGAHVAKLTLLGNYLASVFVAASDGHGGTVVSEVSANTNLQLAQPHAV
jgi:hypothetical protein